MMLLRHWSAFFTTIAHVLVIIISESPSFLERPRDVSTLAGDDVLLTCEASGDPEPDIHWSRKDQVSRTMTMMMLFHNKRIP